MYVCLSCVCLRVQSTTDMLVTDVGVDDCVGAEDDALHTPRAGGSLLSAVVVQGGGPLTHEPAADRLSMMAAQSTFHSAVRAKHIRQRRSADLVAR